MLVKGRNVKWRFGTRFGFLAFNVYAYAFVCLYVVFVFLHMFWGPGWSRCLSLVVCFSCGREKEGGEGGGGREGTGGRWARRFRVFVHPTWMTVRTILSRFGTSASTEMFLIRGPVPEACIPTAISGSHARGAASWPSAVRL